MIRHCEIGEGQLDSRAGKLFEPHQSAHVPERSRLVDTTSGTLPSTHKLLDITSTRYKHADERIRRDARYGPPVPARYPLWKMKSFSSRCSVDRATTYLRSRYHSQYFPHSSTHRVRAGNVSRHRWGGELILCRLGRLGTPRKRAWPAQLAIRDIHYDGKPVDCPNSNRTRCLPVSHLTLFG